jgi:hypothetical protein
MVAESCRDGRGMIWPQGAWKSTGITGNVGGEGARALLNAGHAVRAVIRDPRKGAVWEALGCDVSLADMNDAAPLAIGCKTLLPQDLVWFKRIEQPREILPSNRYRPVDRSTGTVQ